MLKLKCLNVFYIVDILTFVYATKDLNETDAILKETQMMSYTYKKVTLFYVLQCQNKSTKVLFDH